LLQPPSIEPAAEVVVEEPLTVEPTLPAPVADETPAPILEQPTPQPEHTIVPEPTFVPEAIMLPEPPPAEAPPTPLEPLAPIAPLQPPSEVVEVEPPPAAEAPPAPLFAAPAVEAPAEAAPAPLAPMPPEVPVEAIGPSQDPALDSIHIVLLRLRDGEALEIGTFPSAAEASVRAQEVVKQIADAEGDAGWPFFGERYLRPDSIVSVDLLEETADKWLGSAARGRWANPGS
jgi:hypothetical protein